MADSFVPTSWAVPASMASRRSVAARVARALVASFILPVAWFIQGVRDVDGLARWLFEYHLSGQFVDTSHAFLPRLVRGWTDFRGYVFGPGRLSGNDGLQCSLAIVFAIAVVALVLFVGLVTANFFNMLPTIDDWGEPQLPALRCSPSGRSDRPAGPGGGTWFRRGPRW